MQFLFPFMGEYSPGVGERVRRVDEKREGVVECIATPGKFNFYGLLFAGDVLVVLDDGSNIVTSGGRFFWTLWERIDQMTPDFLREQQQKYDRLLREMTLEELEDEFQSCPSRWREHRVREQALFLKDNPDYKPRGVPAETGVPHFERRRELLRRRLQGMTRETLLALDGLVPWQQACRDAELAKRPLIRQGVWDWLRNPGL